MALKLPFSIKKKNIEKTPDLTERTAEGSGLTCGQVFSEDEMLRFRDRNVLVGVVRSKRQRDLNIEKLFYHIPVSQCIDCQFPVRFVVIYQSKKQFGKESGIRFMGEVESTMTVPRREIKEIPKNSDEKYLYFKIKKWYKLKRTVEADGMDGAAFSTTSYLLGTSKRTSELRLKNLSECEFYRDLIDYVSGLVKRGITDGDDMTYGDHRLVFKKGTLCIFFGDVIECAVGYDVFLEEPMKVIGEMLDYYPEV